MDCSLPGSSVHGIIQTTILEWAAISFSRGSSWPRDGTCFSCIGRWVLYGSAVKNPGQCRRLGFDPWVRKIYLLEKEMTTLSSILTWTEKPGGVQSMGSHNSQTWLSNEIATPSQPPLSYSSRLSSFSLTLAVVSCLVSTSPGLIPHQSVSVFLLLTKMITWKRRSKISLYCSRVVKNSSLLNN